MVEEANKLWVFFQKFIDEQSIDQMKIIRSPEHPMRDKFEAMEWYARYVEFVTPDSIISGVKTFRDKYCTPTMTEERKDLKDTQHRVEVIPTILEHLRNLKRKIKAQEVDIATYDQQNAMLLMILDPLLINDQCLLEVQQLGGTEVICTLMMEQPMPSEIDNPDDWEYTKKYVNTSFRYVLKCLLQMVRD